MSFMNFDESKTTGGNGQNFNKITKTGVYTLTIENVSIETKGGYEVASIKAGGADGQVMIYSAIWLKNPDGEENKGAYKMHRMMKYAGLKDISTKKTTLDLGTHGSKEILEVPELRGKEFKFALTMEHSRYNGIKSELTLRNVYGVDEDTSRVESMLKDNFRDGLTPYDIETPDAEPEASDAGLEQDNSDDIL